MKMDINVGGIVKLSFLKLQMNYRSNVSSDLIALVENIDVC